MTPSQPHETGHDRCTDKAPCGPACPHWEIVLSGEQLEQLKDLVTLVPTYQAPAPISGGLIHQTCPHCGRTI